MKKNIKINYKDKNAKKKNNILKITFAFVLIIAVIFLTAFFIPKRNGSFNLDSVKGYFQVKNYLDSICNEKYDKAFKNLYYYDYTMEKGSAKSFEEAYDIWHNRVDNLRHDEFSEFLKKYDNLKVYMSDGNLICSVRIYTDVRGVEKVYTTNIPFYEGKIAGISTETYLTELESALSGKLN